MALRVAVASAVVSRKVGRGRHRLGAFFCAGTLARMRRLLVLVSSIIFVDALLFTALTPLVPEYADEFELSKAGPGFSSARSAPARSSAASRAGSPRRGSDPSARSSLGLSCSRSRASRSRRRQRVHARRRSLRPGPREHDHLGRAHSRGSPSPPRAPARRGDRYRIRGGRLRRGARTGVRRAR